MIAFWVNAAGSFAIEQYLARRAPQLANTIQPHHYERLEPSFETSASTHIFSAGDQLTPGGRDAVAALYDRLSAVSPAAKLLNDPRRVRRRYDLLTMLSNTGINTFRARRATDIGLALRFPVFVREESQHNGALTALLTSHRELERALRALRARGYPVADLLIVEFCDLADADGVFRTASAVKLGEHIIPVHLLSGRRWMLKWEESDHGERAMQENLEYVIGNPHQAWIRRIFDLAGVDFGRIDYGIRGDTLQAWEINTNPTLGPPRGPDPPPFAPKLEALLQESRRFFHAALRGAFQELDATTGGTQVTVRIDPALVARMRAEAARVERHDKLLELLRRIYSLPLIGRLFRAAYSRFLPRM